MDLSHADVTAAVDARHWRVVLGHLQATFRTGSFVRGAELVAEVTRLAEAAGHHPDVVLRYPAVTLTLVSHDVGRLTERDVELARAISAVADAQGLEADPAAPRMLEVAVDALDIPAVLPFWRAVLGYVDDRSAPGRLVDPEGRGPVVWFQQMAEPRPQRNRLHLDVDVPHDLAERRVADAVAAGGRVVGADRAPAFWVLADAEGNEVCVCTWQGRD
ncbi:pterin-4-alpha-carbinolamine dehydratase [Actinotalea ferrariae CF5-4]|uniref:Putative pterin-4-alpha-carbinolamine dehydratase n=1 Tax=Actinotalea ferrariae CF5-4 TaxID=948458 RepID=A0A021W0X7_9CELL|nr:VOC family protein [Actinotalea ferrariae]EYR64977.1 pterin-4-alpha-carbinolamine dehydratase [Actinotalea ferrariae CF5-4]